MLGVEAPKCTAPDSVAAAADHIVALAMVQYAAVVEVVLHIGLSVHDSMPLLGLKMAGRTAAELVRIVCIDQIGSVAHTLLDFDHISHQVRGLLLLSLSSLVFVDMEQIVDIEVAVLGHTLIEVARMGLTKLVHCCNNFLAHPLHSHCLEQDLGQCSGTLKKSLAVEQKSSCCRSKGFDETNCSIVLLACDHNIVRL